MLTNKGRDLEFVMAVVVPFVLYGVVSILFLVVVLPLMLLDRVFGSAVAAQSHAGLESILGATLAAVVVVAALGSLASVLTRGVVYFRDRALLKCAVIIGILAGCVLSGVMLVLAGRSLWPFSIIYVVSPGFSLLVGVKAILALILDQFPHEGAGISRFCASGERNDQ
jgi:hypothetical protein